MGRIVAAPTAGSCGILPAALLTMRRQKSRFRKGLRHVPVHRLCRGHGHCQQRLPWQAPRADVRLSAAPRPPWPPLPSWSWQAVPPKMVEHAIACQKHTGLVCDPVAGLVEIPCIKRNASGVAGAFVAAELALAGIESAIPADKSSGP